MKIKLLLVPILLLTSILSYILSRTNLASTLFLSFTSSTTFWCAVLLSAPPKFYRRVYSDVRKGRAYWVSFATYLTFHTLLYGVFLTVLTGYLNFYPVLYYGIGYAIPPSPEYFIYWVSTSPAFWMFVGSYEIDILPFTVVAGLLLSLLVSSNVQRVLELHRLVKQRRLALSLVAVPVLALVSGTACCISLPTVIIFYVSLSLGTVLSVLPVLGSPLYFNTVYYGLPLLSILLLYYNLVLLERVRWKVCKVN